MVLNLASTPVAEATQVVAQSQPTTVIVQSQAGPPPPAGVPEGGMWIQENYCGAATWIVGILICPWVCFCPFDTRTVYVVNGVRYNHFGAMVPQGPC
ncbi:unnamed protein product [Ascophyllum nodosum]